ncbi:hypothetical protein JCM10213_003285 [Rhodosporidiobolus nylandii]
MQHPVQAVTSTPTVLITASAAQLSVFDAATNAPLSSNSTAHTALVRLLAPFVDQDGKEYLVSTGEDKKLVVFALPTLEVLSTRELVKRANALQITQDGTVVVGDKFGDVYLYPLHYTAPPAPPAPEGKQKKKGNAGEKKEPLEKPILGHVSMLNTLALIPKAPEAGLVRDWIATGDRDEHVRISRFPRGEVIEKFGWGSKGFVSSLLYLPPTSTSPPFLLSAGADPSIQVFSLPDAQLVKQFEIEDLLAPHLAVAPEMAAPVPAGRRKDKRGEKGKGKAAEGEGEEKDEEMKEEKVGEQEETPKELPKGLAVVKMFEVGTTREDGGVVVLAAGSTALLYVPFSALLPSSSPSGVPSLLPFAHPILDFTPLTLPTAATSACEFLLSLDSSRFGSSLPTAEEPTPLARVSLGKDGQLAALPMLTTDAVLLASAAVALPEGAKAPGVSNLYPVLQLLHHPGDEPDFGDEDEGVPKKAKGKAGAKGPNTKKRAADARSDATTEIRGGKRAIGRAETLRRYEEAKRKLSEGGAAAESLTEGERAAVSEIEAEAEAEEKAEEEGAKVA